MGVAKQHHGNGNGGGRPVVKAIVVLAMDIATWRGACREKAIRAKKMIRYFWK